MKTAALVVGCQEYPHLNPDETRNAAPAGSAARGAGVRRGGAEASTAGPAVSGAVAMRDWLVGAGGVRPSDLRLLLSPAPENPVGSGRGPKGPVRVDGPADLECFTAELRRLLTTVSGDRLYLYIAAQSCLSDPEQPFLGRPLILLRDFDPAAPATGSVALEELAAHLGHADFREVVTVLDCAPGVPVVQRVLPSGLGTGWRGRRRTGAPMQFRIQTSGETSWGTTPSRSAAVPSVAATTVTAAFLSAVTPAASVASDRSGGTGEPVRWSSLERHLTSVMPSPPTVSGPDPGMILTPMVVPPMVVPPMVVPDEVVPPKVVPDGVVPDGAVPDRPPGAAGVSAAGGTSDGVPGDGADGEVELRCADPNAMLIIEDRSGLRCAVGVGSISGRLPAGRYTALLADPYGADPRVPLTVSPVSAARAVLSPRPRPDGFRVTDETAVMWSSPAAQLALATSALWAHGHQSFLLVGGAPSLPSAADLLDGFPDSFAAQGALTSAGAGWWVARPVSGPWHGVGVGGHLLTVPAAPDSVSAVAIAPSGVSVALFDTTHPEPAEIAAQDRVQEYLAIDRLGAADLTSRSAVHTGQHWPWGASAAVRRFIDRITASRAGEPAVPERSADIQDDAPPYEFRADVPPPLRRLLVGQGPWAVWLDWPAAGRVSDGARLTRSG